ncbi:MAG TPA: dienelactone hydrolase family protein [Ferruginibacter sp.]|nr:dienelactone hydrolase family protein [Ferruginibacter sp.]
MDAGIHKVVSIPVGNGTVEAELFIPLSAQAIVIFSHGSGSSRFSKRNRMVAKFLQEKYFGTLLLDLLTEEEDKIYDNRFNIPLLSKRLSGATEWLEKLPAAKHCRIGFFGASTGAASALKAASGMHKIAAVVCRGGRPDLAMNALPKVSAPTLLIVGSLDENVLQLNKEAYSQLNCIKKLEVVPGASHLFEEPGTMDIVSALAANWFQKYLSGVAIVT